jgi:molybdopterin molybdotransferase
VKPLREAQREVLAAMEPLPAEAVPLDHALGLALAQPVTAPHDVPPFANSAVDGFAVVAADTAAFPVTLAVLEDVPAGATPRRRVRPGSATKIMTGAPLPEGADAVVMVEETTAGGDGSVVIGAAVEPGTAVRPAGGDVRAGQVVLDAGTRLGPAHVALLGALGIAAPLVGRRPRVALMSTGDEVLPADAASLPPGAIRDANRPMLKALLTELGAEVMDLGIVPDDAVRLRAALHEGRASADCVVTSGGVSMGEYDLVKQVLGDLGDVEFWKVAMQPAKPFAFGFLGTTPLFGLPGNPVSVMVAFEQFVRPALLTRMGARSVFRRRLPGVMGERVVTAEEKTVFLRVSVDRGDAGWTASLSGGQDSNVLSALAEAEAFAVVPAGIGVLEAGEPVEMEMFRWPEARPAEEVLRWTT